MAKTIDQRTVTRYCKRARALNKVKKIQDIEKKKIVDALLAGSLLPDGGPYVIDLSPVGGKEQYDWKQAYEDQLTKAKVKKFGVSEKVGRAMAQVDMEATLAAQSDKPSVSIGGVDYVGGVKLMPRVNESYRVVETLDDKAVA